MSKAKTGLATRLRRLADRLDPRDTITLDRPSWQVRAGLVVESVDYTHDDRSVRLTLTDSVDAVAEVIEWIPKRLPVDGY